jgi:hypothetical protein
MRKLIRAQMMEKKCITKIYIRQNKANNLVLIHNKNHGIILNYNCYMILILNIMVMFKNFLSYLKNLRALFYIKFMNLKKK